MQEERTEPFVRRGLMVDRQQPAIRRACRRPVVSTKAEPFHAIVVVTSTLVEIVVRAIVLVGKHPLSERVTQAIEGSSQKTENKAR